jgi:SAM-dependent methyltransferase
MSSELSVRAEGAVPPSVLDAFRCPVCRQPADLDGDGVRCRRGDGDGVRCQRGHVTPWRDGYLDACSSASGLVDAEATRRTSESFGYEWTRFAGVHAEDEVFWRRYFADVDLSWLRGHLGLDAGCGNGRFSRFTAPHLEALVASDGSIATRAAAARLGGLPNLCVVRADLRSMPFAEESFGFISCLGVLHHLADPAAGLAALTWLLAPGGRMLVYLYSRPERAGLRSSALRAAAGLRRVTVRMPLSVLRLLCWPLAAALYVSIVVPGTVGDRLRFERLASIPLATYRRHPLRSLWLDTFDRLSAPLERRFTEPEARSLFVGCGLSVIAFRSQPQLAGFVVLASKAAE